MLGNAGLAAVVVVLITLLPIVSNSLDFMVYEALPHGNLGKLDVSLSYRKDVGLVVCGVRRWSEQR